MAQNFADFPHFTSSFKKKKFYKFYNTAICSNVCVNVESKIFTFRMILSSMNEVSQTPSKSRPWSQASLVDGLPKNVCLLREVHDAQATHCSELVK